MQCCTSNCSKCPPASISGRRADALQRLDRQGDALPAADAQRDDAALAAVALHRVDQSCRQHRAAGADRMAMRDGAALDVDDVLGEPSSRRQASAIAAKASLISTRSTSPTDQPARCSACRTAGTGPRPNMPARPRRRRSETSRAIGARPCFSAQARSATTIAAAPRVQARRIARGDRAVLAERGLELGQGLGGRVGAVVLVLGERTGPFAALHLDRRDLGVELARGLRRGEALLRAQRPAVLLLARDLVLRTRSSVCQPECWPEKASFSPS